MDFRKDSNKADWDDWQLAEEMVHFRGLAAFPSTRSDVPRWIREAFTADEARRADAYLAAAVHDTARAAMNTAFVASQRRAARPFGWCTERPGPGIHAGGGGQARGWRASGWQQKGGANKWTHPSARDSGVLRCGARLPGQWGGSATSASGSVWGES
ncbi:hypothetical protein PV350_36070 [Streptomyces sp. PA03-6a]|nr:hypothetical protein [Streptomyces sp. PA03-6a]